MRVVFRGINFLIFLVGFVCRLSIFLCLEKCVLIVVFGCFFLVVVDGRGACGGEYGWGVISIGYKGFFIKTVIVDYISR